jgi:hypothetical protein
MVITLLSLQPKNVARLAKPSEMNVATDGM